MPWLIEASRGIAYFARSLIPGSKALRVAHLADEGQPHPVNKEERFVEAASTLLFGLAFSLGGSAISEDLFRLNGTDSLAYTIQLFSAANFWDTAAFGVLTIVQAQSTSASK